MSEKCKIHLETIQFVCIVNQLIGFNMSATLVCYGLIICPKLGRVRMNQYIDHTRFHVISYFTQ